MKRMFLALLVCLIVLPLAKAQDDSGPEAQRFKISSLNTPFAMQGDFEGEYRVYPDRIKLKVTKAEISISEHCPYKGRRLLSALKFDLATATEGKSWKMIDAGHAMILNEGLSPGDKVTLDELHFDILTNDSIDLAKHWLVVQMADNVLDVPAEKRRDGSAFAHSSRDVFSLRDKLPHAEGSSSKAQQSARPRR